MNQKENQYCLSAIITKGIPQITERNSQYPFWVGRKERLDLQGLPLSCLRTNFIYAIFIVKDYRP